MLSFFSRDNLAGVDIGASGIKIVRLKKSGSSYVLKELGYHKFGEIAPDNIPLQKEALHKLITANKTRFKDAATQISTPALSMRHIYLPEMPKKDLKEAVKWELKKQVTFPPEEMICDFSITDTIKKGDVQEFSIMAFAVSRKEVDKLLDIFAASGINVVSIDVMPMAMLRAFDANYSWEEGVNYAMIDIGALKTVLSIFKDRKLKFAREIQLGGNDITMAIANGLSKSPNGYSGGYSGDAEAEKIRHGMAASDDNRAREFIVPVIDSLVLQIHRSFDYYQAQFRETPVSKVILCGGTAGLKDIEEFFTENLGVPCFRDDPFKNITVDKNTFKIERDALPIFTTAVGLSLWQR